MVLHQGTSEESRCRRVRADAWWLRSQSTGLLVPPSCRAWVCDWCGPRRARRLARAVDAARYDRWVTLTRAPRDLLQGVRRAAHLLRAEGGWEWCWSAEAGEVSGMVHVHACVRGPYVAQARLSVVAQAAGFGAVSWIESGLAGRAGEYTAKAARYTAKGASTYRAWVDLNGGKRPWHWSRGYTGGMPMRDFIPYYSPAKDPGPWQRVPAPPVS